jgi:hypothetical protein
LSLIMAMAMARARATRYGDYPTKVVAHSPI